MNKKKIYCILFVISALLFIGFAVRLTVDYVKYEEILTSFPFYAFVIERSVEFLLPSIVVLTAALIIRRKSRKD